MFAVPRLKAISVLSLLALVAAATGSGQVLAQDKFPSRSIKIVTPLAAGAASDIALRFLADRLSTRLRVPATVENQPGAGGVTAARSVTNAPHDGYTIGWFGNNTAISVSLFSQSFDPRKETKPIVGVSEFSYLFVTNATSSYNTLQDLISTARSKPGTINVGASSAGTSNHLTALLFKSLLKLDVTVVPYRGPSELSIALIRKDVDLVVNAYGGLRQGIEDKQTRALATTSAARLDELPDVPTMAEAGRAGFQDFVVVCALCAGACARGCVGRGSSGYERDFVAGRCKSEIQRDRVCRAALAARCTRSTHALRNRAMGQGYCGIGH